MLTILHKKLPLTAMLITLAFGMSAAQAEINPAKKYEYQGQITAVDKVGRLLTIETSTFKGNKDHTTLATDIRAYEVSVGIKLKNVPKSEQYSGLKNLQPGVMLYFNVKRGTEKNKIPVITEAWVEFQ